MRIAFIDDMYGDAFNVFVDRHPQFKGLSYREQCDYLLSQSFGTADFWDIALRSAGHESQTTLWPTGNLFEYMTSVFWSREIAPFSADVVVVQNVDLFGPAMANRLFPNRTWKLVAMCSCAKDDSKLVGWDAVFTSFPWLVDHLKRLGQRCEYLPLAFGKSVLDRIGTPPERDLPLTFVGGLRSNTWKQGVQTMAAVAEAFPEFEWYGYHSGPIPQVLLDKFKGPVYGLDYFRILMRSQITLNRHGEIARGFGNNMRQYEALGCGASLVNDCEGELGDFPGLYLYRPNEIVDGIRSMQDTTFPWPKMMKETALRGQQSILNHHTYEHRVPKLLEVLVSL